MKNTPVYRFPWSYASENGETELYRASMKANKACKDKIEAAVDSCYKGWSLDTKTVIQTVADEFGTDRLTYLVANTIREKYWDGRFSKENIKWAFSIPVFEDESSFAGRKNQQLIINSHPGLIDLVATALRKETYKDQL